MLLNSVFQTALKILEKCCFFVKELNVHVSINTNIQINSVINCISKQRLMTSIFYRK